MQKLNPLYGAFVTDALIARAIPFTRGLRPASPPGRSLGAAIGAGNLPSYEALVASLPVLVWPPAVVTGEL